MSIDEYKTAVVELFKSGRASDEQWEEMAQVVLDSSERDGGVPEIDKICLAVGEIVMRIDPRGLEIAQLGAENARLRSSLEALKDWLWREDGFQKECEFSASAMQAINKILRDVEGK